MAVAVVEILVGLYEAEMQRAAVEFENYAATTAVVAVVVVDSCTSSFITDALFIVTYTIEWYIL